MKKVVTFGEVMLRLATPDYLRFAQANNLEVSFGGGEANVAVSLANYGLPVELVTRLPQNDIADACLMELRRFGVDTDRILRGGDRLGIYFLEKGAVNRGSKVVYDRSHSAISEIKPGMVDWDAVFEEACWFHWTGITPALSQDTADVCLEAVKAARRHGVTVSCDLNFRKMLWKYGASPALVMQELVSYCDIILGNEEDAEKYFGIKPEGFDAHTVGSNMEGVAFESVCRELKALFPQASKIVVTLRGAVNANHNTWSAVLFDGIRFHHAPMYDITHIVDRVGGGDSLMGGLIYGLLAYPGDDKKALGFAVAASCLKHTISGDFNLVTVDEVEKLMNGDGSGRVSR